LDSNPIHLVKFKETFTFHPSMRAIGYTLKYIINILFLPVNSLVYSL